MTQSLYCGHYTQVERVPRMVSKSTHAALAQNDLIVALAHDVLSCHEELFKRGRDAALQQDRPSLASCSLQQREVLHVARADLDHIGVLIDQFQSFVVDGFGNDPQAELVANLRHDLERLFAQSLKSIRRSARLIGPTAEELRACRCNLFSYSKGLLARFNGAGAGNHGQVASADSGIGAGEANDRVLFLHIPADQFVRLGDANDLGDAGKLFEVAAINLSLVAGDADSGALRAGKRMGTIA